MVVVLTAHHAADHHACKQAPHAAAGLAVATLLHGHRALHGGIEAQLPAGRRRQFLVLEVLDSGHGAAVAAGPLHGAEPIPFLLHFVPGGAAGWALGIGAGKGVGLQLPGGQGPAGGSQLFGLILAAAQDEIEHGTNGE